jgi:hypothetical protein
MSYGWALHTTGSRQFSFARERAKRFAFSVASIAMCYIALFAQAEARAQEPALAAPTILQAGSAIQHNISGKAVDSYSIALTSGQCAQLIVEQRGIDVVVQVLDAQSKVLAEFDSDMRPLGRENVLIAPDDDGIYGIRVKPRYSRATLGAYEIRVVEIRPPTEQDRELYKAHQLATEAASLKDVAKYDDGIARAQEAVTLAEKALGPDDTYVGIVTAQLANLLWTKGDFSKAGTVAERAIRIARQDPHPNDPQTAFAMDVLALVYRVTEQGPKAEETLKELIAIRNVRWAMSTPGRSLTVLSSPGNTGIAAISMTTFWSSNTRLRSLTKFWSRTTFGRSRCGTISETFISIWMIWITRSRSRSKHWREWRRNMGPSIRISFCRCGIWARSHESENNMSVLWNCLSERKK